MLKMQIKLLTTTAKVLSYAHTNDAGMDMYAAEEYTLAVGERVQVKTGIAVAIPEGYVGLIWDKSGISHKNGLKVMGGVIDAGYRGEILVGIVNLGVSPHTFNIGDKVAQMLVQKIEQPTIVVVDALDSTSRGSSGFGSTGV